MLVVRRLPTDLSFRQYSCDFNWKSPNEIKQFICLCAMFFEIGSIHAQMIFEVSPADFRGRNGNFQLVRCTEPVHRKPNSTLIISWLQPTMIGKLRMQERQEGMMGGAMRFTIKFIALCLAPKWQKHTYTERLEKVMPKWLVVHVEQMNWIQCAYACKCLYRIRFSVPFGENCLTRICDGNHIQQ